MREIRKETAAGWLVEHGWPASGAQTTELGGGVSNTVILVQTSRHRVIVKQSLGRLRVEETWCSDPARIFREAAALRYAGQLITAGCVPAVLIEDHADFAIAMEAAPAAAAMWKTKLFRGEICPADAHKAGAILGQLLAGSWMSPEARALFGDQTVFNQLRIDPYYRFTAARHPALADYFNRLMEDTAARAVCLVHGDWSPKNLLAGPDAMWVIDWEVVHFGDPGFDAGFLLNHLLLKSIALPRHHRQFAALAAAFRDSLDRELPPGAGWIHASALEHLPALLLARVDGKSPAEYLDDDGRRRARDLAFDLMNRPARSVEEVFAR